MAMMKRTAVSLGCCLLAWWVMGQGAAMGARRPSDRTAEAPVKEPVLIQDVRIEEVPGGQATVSWTTDIPTRSVVEYDIDEAYEMWRAAEETLATRHQVNLRGLIAGVTYHLRIRARDAQGVEALSDGFTIAMTPRAMATGGRDAQPPAMPEPHPLVIVEAPKRPSAGHLTETPRSDHPSAKPAARAGGLFGWLAMILPFGTSSSKTASTGPPPSQAGAQEGQSGQPGAATGDVGGRSPDTTAPVITIVFPPNGAKFGSQQP